MKQLSIKFTFHVAAEYAKLPIIPAYLQPGLKEYTYGVNFASGGAGALVETFQGFVLLWLIICFPLLRLLVTVAESESVFLEIRVLFVSMI